MHEPQKIDREEVAEKLRRLGVDPIRTVALIAEGDVVALGLMTQEDFDADPVYNTDDIEVKPSGRVTALKLIPLRMRLEASKELAQYLHPKKREDNSAKIIDAEEPVTFYLPHNGRDRKQIGVKEAEIVD